MKHILITTIAAVVLVGCGESQQSAPTPEATPVEPVAEVPAQPSPPPVEAKPAEPVAEAAKPTTPPKAVTANKGADPARGIKPEPPTVKPPDISISKAAIKGNIEAIKQHIAAGTDVNAKGRGFFQTPLQFAANKGHKEIAELLIAEGADVNAKGWKGLTPLHDAAYYGHKEIAELLVAKGADVNAKVVSGVRQGETPLDAANATNQSEIADLLRKHGGKTSEWFKAEESIHIAAKIGHFEAVRQHLAAGADVTAIDHEGNTPLHHAAYKGHKKIVELLIAKGADVNAKGIRELTPLHFAVGGGHKEPVELLIAEGADVNAKDKNGYTPIWIANQSNHQEIADLLRKHGAKTGEKLKELEAPRISIHAAAITGNIEAVKKHITAGTDVNAKKYGNTALHWAAYHGRKEIAELLIAKGADVNVKNESGWTPLHQAALANVKAIRTVGVDLNAKDEDGATHWYDDDMVLLEQKEIAELLIDKGANVNAKDAWGGTPLHKAAANGKKEVAELLIAAGADVNAKTNNDTPLHAAASHGQTEVVELLIAKGADVNAKVKDGRTPLDKTEGKNHTETADLLRKHGGKTSEELKAEGK
jgi:cytohesin